MTERTPAQKLASIVRRLTDVVDSCQTKLDKWADRFKEDPVYALSWSRELFTVAADMRLAQEMLDLVELWEANKNEPEEIFEAIVENLTRSLTRSAKYVPSSTSQTSNLMEAEQNAAFARLLGDFAWMG